MNALKSFLQNLLSGLDQLGAGLPQLGLRLLLAYEFWQAGIEKLHGQNWFADIQHQFPFPFNLIPAEWSWQLATGFELIGPIALVLGLGTRFFALSLSVLTLVAWVSVHAGHGYNVCDGGWKLPLMYLVMFMPLIFSGPGKLSIDHGLRLRYWGGERRLWS